MASNGDVEISQDTVIVLAVVLPIVVAIAVILYLICSGCCDPERKPSEDSANDEDNNGGRMSHGDNNRGLSNVAAPTEKTALLSSKPKITTTSSSNSFPNTATTESAVVGKNDVEQPLDSKSWASLSSIEFLNPMDMLGISGEPPIVWPTMMEGPEQALLTKNNPVLFEIYLFYAFHADKVRDARTNGKTKPSFVGSEAYRAAVMSPNPCDQPLLSHANFQDLSKDFKLLSGSVTAPWLTNELLTKEEEDSITYRRFVALLMKVGEKLKPEAPRDKALLNVIETMDCSEQIYIMQETGQMHNNSVQFVTDMSK